MKELRKIIGLLAIGIVASCFTALQGFSQNIPNSGNPGMNVGDGGVDIDTVYSAHPIRDSDKMYQIGVWRRIDLREKYNLPFYGTGGLKRDGIMMNIYNAVVDNSI